MRELPSAEGATLVRVVLNGETLDAPTPEAAWDAAESLRAKHGGGMPRFSYFAPAPVVAPVVAPVAPAPAPVAPVVSTFAAPVVDATAKARVDASHAALASAGLTVGKAGGQLYANGTRLATVGYDTQRDRRAMHDAALPIRDAAAALAAAVAGEGREDREMSAGELARGLAVNGKITAHGFALTEQAIRGLLARIDSPALSYVLGLRARIVETLAAKSDGFEARVKADKAKIADVLAHECARAADVSIKLRARKGPGEIFAIVSPSYARADAPDVVGQIIRDLPDDAKGTWSYDAASTAWELRAAVWTPTPVDEQAVGEPFAGYVSFRSKDNGTGRFSGGGGLN
jgi:hypothetical protein